MAEAKEISTASGDAPSRIELLSMVRKHSNLLGEAVVDEQDDSDIGMDARFWHEMLDLYFIRGRVSKGKEEDDLIFFVRNMSLHGYGFNDNMESVSPYFVRRWAPMLEKVVGEYSGDIDWGSSFYLNLIAHTSFTITVAICSIQDLRKHQNGENTSLSPIYKVVKTVYASPSRVNFHLDERKAAETLPAYPNICFAIDDFDDTFDAVVLTEVDHCYCVILNANGGAAFPADNDPQDNNLSRPSGNDNDGKRVKPSKLTLFSGFVSYQMVREAYDDQSRESTGPKSLHQLSKKGLGTGLGSIVHKAASAASELAKHAYAATSSGRKFDEELLPLKCCLMSISLPWETIAHDLLFKVSVLSEFWETIAHDLLFKSSPPLSL
ncbi:uncharacterized protein KIAA0930 homolog isoform X3 [Ananas comosus]|uniref:Uncharacterized protein KIAA0930 homolog isoform X3 n=1 Tax=Ananas comosus TaxID=4615 RepID=A0A6P5FXL1_ANACO|nr:uncharacterized protein KIAA0930 homolog isoform X3 [Ananas comosus]